MPKMTLKRLSVALDDPRLSPYGRAVLTAIAQKLIDAGAYVDVDTVVEEPHELDHRANGRLPQ
jgi:hypothetical protein